jgi:cell division protein FtsZ
MSNRGAALMGTGQAGGDERAVEAAQHAICSPFLDNVSINGATGVLVNITGGTDMTIDEVTTINSIIQEAAGEDGEMIFGVVEDPHLKDVIRVTVIATGFGEPMEDEDELPAAPARPEPVVIGSGFDGPQLVEERKLAEAQARVRIESRSSDDWNDHEDDGEDLEIPTFIRRQMD